MSLKLAHYSWGQSLRINKRGPFWTLILFFVAVGYFGTYPLDAMTFEFSAPQLTQSHDIDPDVECYRKAETDDPLIYCSVPSRDAIAYVEVENKGKTVLTDREPPFEFSVDSTELEEVVGQRNFHVILRDQNGHMIRRYVRSASLVDTRRTGDTTP